MPTNFRRLPFLDQIEIFEAKDFEADFPLHLHDQICITLVTSGLECTRLGKQELYTPFKGISFTYPDEIHANPNKNQGAYSFLTFYISPDVLRYFSNSKIFSFRNRVVEDSHLFDWFWRIGNSNTPDEANLTALIRYLSHYNLSSIPNGVIIEKEQALNFTEVLQYIQDQVAEPFTVDHLATICDLSVYTFIRRFKRATGITPAQYVILKRIEVAKTCLRTGAPIADAVFEAGFYDQSHMSRNFKKVTGMTPRAFQKACNSVQ